MNDLNDEAVQDRVYEDARLLAENLGAQIHQTNLLTQLVAVQMLSSSIVHALSKVSGASQGEIASAYRATVSRGNHLGQDGLHVLASTFTIADAVDGRAISLLAVRAMVSADHDGASAFLRLLAASHVVATAYRLDITDEVRERAWALARLGRDFLLADVIKPRVTSPGGDA